MIPNQLQNITYEGITAEALARSIPAHKDIGIFLSFSTEEDHICIWLTQALFLPRNFWLISFPSHLTLELAFGSQARCGLRVACSDPRGRSLVAGDGT